MELQQLRYFLTVAEQLNFREAADLLYITQPTLSKQISNLEHELGQQLFIRNTRQVQLTPAGVILKQDAKALLRFADNIPAHISHGEQAPVISGSLRIGIEDGYDRINLIGALSAFKAKYPAVHVEIFDFHVDRGAQMLASDQIDCAFVLFPDREMSDDIVCQIIQRDQISLIASAGDISSQSLAEYVQLAYEKELYLLNRSEKWINLMNNAFSSWGRIPEFRFVEDIRSILLYVEFGGGIGVVPRTVYEAYDSPYLTAYHILPEVAATCTICAWHEFHDNPLRDLFLDEFPICMVHCRDCPNTWCKYYMKAQT